MVTQELVEAMNATSVPAPHEVDEFAYAGLQTEASKVVRPPRVAGSPVHLECRYVQTTRLRSIAPADNRVVFGEVIGIHIDDRVIENGIVAWNKLRPVGRLGYLDYSPIETIITHPRPKWTEEERG
jgi:flavin reductase (DIM6/NTAB) family NADH-FMN oxidoreductase RutF